MALIYKLLLTLKANRQWISSRSFSETIRPFCVFACGDYWKFTWLTTCRPEISSLAAAAGCSKVFCWSLNVNEVDEFLRRHTAAFPLSLYLSSNSKANSLPASRPRLSTWLYFCDEWCTACWLLGQTHVRALSQHKKHWTKSACVCYLWSLSCMRAST